MAEDDPRADDLRACTDEAQAAGRDEPLAPQKRIDPALRASEQRYRNLISASNQVLYRHSADWSEMRQLTGGGFLADTPEPDRDWFQKYIHPDDQPHVWDRIQEAIRTKSLFELEHRVIRADGTLGWTLSRSIPVFDEQGEIVEWFGMAADVTERRRAEERLRESEHRLRLAAEAADVGTWDFNPATGELSWDERCKRFFGLQPDAEITYEIFLDGLHPEDRERTDAAVQRALEPVGPGEYDVEYRTVGIGDKIERWIAAKGRAIFEGEGESRRAIRFIGTVIDISDRRRAADELSEESHTLETLNRVGSAIASELDLERVVQMVTDAGVDLTGAQFGAFFYNVIDAKGESYTLYTLSGVDRSAFDKFPMPRNTHVFGPTFRGEGIVRSDDITKDPRYGKNPPY
jgi:PAS domain S-box-containing protein